MWSVVCAVVTAGIVSVQVVQVVQGDESCLSGDESPYVWFGTKTAYPFVTTGVPNGRIHDVPGCRPVSLWMLFRHGSHLPDSDELRDIQLLDTLRERLLDNYRAGNYRQTGERICEADIQLLERWIRPQVANPGALTSEGYLSVQRLGQAWRQRYPGLFTRNRHDYLFKFANEPRVSTSLRAFAEGVFGQQLEAGDVPRGHDDKLLRPHLYCPAWRHHVEENNDTRTQLTVFRSKGEYREMLSNVSRRMGFTYELDASTVRAVYLMCRYNKAWDVVQLSAWCSVFTKEDLRRLEYEEDLTSYYSVGYGSSLSSKLGCGLARDMMDFFTGQINAEESPQQPRVKVHVGTAESLSLLATSLGAFRDRAPLTGDNYHGALTQARRWRTSYLAPYSGNMAAVLYRCGSGEPSRHQVLLMWGEQPLQLDECRVGLCSWSRLVEQLSVTGGCDTTFCNGAPVATLASTPTLLLVATLTLLAVAQLFDD